MDRSTDSHVSPDGEAGEGKKPGFNKKKLIAVLSTIVALAVVGGGVTFFLKSKPDAQKNAEHAKGAAAKDSSTAAHGAEAAHGHVAEAEMRPKGLVAQYVAAFRSIQKKVDDLRESEEQNDKLRLENVNLRLQIEKGQFECRSNVSEEKTADISTKLVFDTGGRVGRTLAGISYRPPVHLLPSQLYTLGVSYLKGSEAEKAAVIFTFLTGMDDNETYKTAKDFLLTGVAWYRIQNFVIADQYFEKALSVKKLESDLRYHAQARLWRALTDERIQKHSKAQDWLRELVDHHPNSQEAQWVNPSSKALKPTEVLTDESSESEKLRKPAGDREHAPAEVVKDNHQTGAKHESSQH